MSNATTPDFRPTATVPEYLAGPFFRIGYTGVKDEHGEVIARFCRPRRPQTEADTDRAISFTVLPELMKATCKAWCIMRWHHAGYPVHPEAFLEVILELEEALEDMGCELSTDYWPESEGGAQ